MRLTLLAVLSLLVASSAHAQSLDKETKEAAQEAPALSKALEGVKVTLLDALKAGERHGTPVSAEFEVEGGRLTLTVVTAKKDAFFEVEVDPKTGKAGKATPIKEGEDLGEAKGQAAAMGKTKRHLRDVVAEAEKANPGFRAVNVEPELESGEPHADVALLKGAESKVVDLKL